MKKIIVKCFLLILLGFVLNSCCGYHKNAPLTKQIDTVHIPYISLYVNVVDENGNPINGCYVRFYNEGHNPDYSVGPFEVKNTSEPVASFYGSNRQSLIVIEGVSISPFHYRCLDGITSDFHIVFVRDKNGNVRKQ
ncbi:MAG: hypothetical protein Q8N83_12005 [Ignavibacteria bacterium]|nr:hypothetical protein [Ignavibacteria bacterium]